MLELRRQFLKSVPFGVGDSLRACDAQGNNENDITRMTRAN